ncbi:hypothetical protein [Gracilibacillus alcaliphilus]|uniref:hypothetical protein n=1 Tax=Gracilibacillus alcaliphilus TaxID=1401441 RepID=UPI0019567774|nr:hypothetical protein [Gracilibacillus alcaliphilus]MBM7675267.1 hypothetical protein [Gracilibacillus alcaliphilus]
MKVYVALIIIVGIIALISTLMLGGRGDADYSESTGRNVTNLTLIYVIAILGSVIALAIFVFI